MTHELRLALRALLRRPLFLVSAVAALGLGLGATAATLGVVDRLLIRPLGFPDPDRLVFITGVLPGDAGPGASLSFTEMRDIAERAATIRQVAGYASSRVVEVEAESGPRAARVNFVNASYFDILGARAAMGRVLGPGDEQDIGAHPVAVVSDAFWRVHLGARRDAVGLTIRVGDLRFTVVGVMSAQFRDVPFESGEGVTDLWASSMMSLPSYGPTFLSSRSSRVIWGVARLNDGATLIEAQAELTTIAAALEREFPATNRQVGFHVERLDRWIFRDAVTPFVVVLVAALALLAAASLNVTGLIVVRASERSRDLAIRRTLGASTVQVLRPGLAEGMIIAGFASVVGVGVAAVLFAFVRTSAPFAFPRLQTVTLDGRALAGLGLAAMAATAMMTAATAILLRWREGHGPDRTRAVTADRRTTQLQRALACGEIGLATVLLVGSVLVARSLATLDRAPIGFSPEGLMTTMVELRGERYRDDAQVVRFGESLLNEVRAEPGIESAFLWGPGRPGHSTWISYILPEREADVPDPPRVMAWRHHLSAGALTDVGIPILRGRDLMATDAAHADIPAVISESMARRFWPGQDPLGQRFSFITPSTPRPWFSIVGVAADAAHRRRTYRLRIPDFDYYVLYDRRPERSLTLVTRSGDNPTQVSERVRAAVRRADPALPIREMRTMDDQLAEEASSFRFAATLIVGFSGLTFLLSAMGLYSLVSYVIALRRQELAVRSALGASGGRLFRSLVWDGLRLGLVGVSVGTVAARGGSAWIASMLYGVDPRAFSVYVVPALAMLALVSIASALPASRVARIDTARSLRE